MIAQGLDTPIGVRESRDGRLIVGEENARSLAWLDRATGGREVIASELRNVTYLATDGDAVLVSTFLPGASDGIVFRVDPNTGTAVPYATGLVVPEGLFVAEDGALVVAEWSTSTVWRFPPGGGSIEDATAIASGFDRVYGLLDLGDGAFLVADHAGRIVQVDADGSQRDVISGIGRPGGLARDAEGALLIAEFVDFGATGRVLRIPGVAAR